jgi:hypothetical protein
MSAMSANAPANGSANGPANGYANKPPQRVLKEIADKNTKRMHMLTKRINELTTYRVTAKNSHAKIQDKFPPLEDNMSDDVSSTENEDSNENDQDWHIDPNSRGTLRVINKKRFRTMRRLKKAPLPIKIAAFPRIFEHNDSLGKFQGNTKQVIRNYEYILQKSEEFKKYIEYWIIYLKKNPYSPLPKGILDVVRKTHATLSHTYNIQENSYHASVSEYKPLIGSIRKATPVVYPTRKKNARVVRFSKGTDVRLIETPREMHMMYREEEAQRERNRVAALEAASAAASSSLGGSLRTRTLRKKRTRRSRA